MNQETPTATPRFVNISIPENRGDGSGVIRFFVIDLNCLNTVCECVQAADSEAIAVALNARGDAFPKRLRMNYGAWHIETPEITPDCDHKIPCEPSSKS